MKRLLCLVLMLGLSVLFLSAELQTLPDHTKLTPKQWREDLQFFAREMPKRHLNAFHHISKEQFDAAVAELDGRLEKLDGDETYVGMARIANSIGDAHTSIRFPRDVAQFPLRLGRIGQAYRVVGVMRESEKALGAELLKIPFLGVLEVLPDGEDNPTFFIIVADHFRIHGIIDLRRLPIQLF